jgi:hypothetical protein
MICTTPSTTAHAVAAAAAAAAVAVTAVAASVLGPSEKERCLTLGKTSVTGLRNAKFLLHRGVQLCKCASQNYRYI